MNHLIYGAIGFLLGGMLGGALVGRIVTKDLKGRIDELEDVNQKLRNENVELRDGKSEQKEQKLKAEEEKVDESYNKIRKMYSKAVDADDEENEENDLIFNGTKVEKIEVQEDDDLEEEKKIRLISEQMYNEELNYRDNEHLTYYQIDGTMVDDANDMLFDEASIVGNDCMDIINDTMNDTLYVLDEKEDKLYEISIEHDAVYTRDVIRS